MRLDLLDNTGDRFDSFRFDKSSGLIASEAPLRLVWRVRTAGALARQSRAMDPLTPQRVQTGLRTCCGALTVLLVDF